jgi:formylmethanofuran dehydrogenase subunit C
MLQLSLKSPTTLPIELAGISPAYLREKSLAEIERLAIWHGREKLSLADLFAIQGDATDECIEFRGDFSSAVGVGEGMTQGSIRVVGNAGRNVGLGMFAGEIEVTGDVGDGLGSEMRGGVIRVGGSAGDFVGGACIGSTRGMTGGTILVSGNAGDEIGNRTRRGLIAIGGSAGEWVGHNMLAGTIVVCGPCGRHAGAGIKRGTLCLLKQDPLQLLPTFRYACSNHVPVLGLIGRELKSLGFENNLSNASRQWQHYSGDYLPSGKGEIFLAIG